MRGLPLWMLGVVGVLAVLLVFVGWEDRHNAGYLPFIMGIVFALFTLAAAGARARGDED
jgi:peptidoglycan/LPS O-acetylase OafA/YrhL